MRIYILFLLCLPGLVQISQAQYTAADTLYGSLNKYRTSFDVLEYELSLTIDPAAKHISGSNTISFLALAPIDTMQLELTDNFKIEKLLWGDHLLKHERITERVFYVYFPKTLEASARHSIEITYKGTPMEAEMPPWSGGFSWREDAHGNPFVGVACEGDGASIWWPCKDHLSDEPENVTMHYTVPDSLVAVGNGRILDTTIAGAGWTTYSWQVTNPINLYNVTLYIGDYVHFSDSYKGINGETLPLNYYVLPAHLKKAKKQFREVHQTLEAFEHYFGPYPFYEDGYKLVETNYLGMEHQSAIAYGNKFMEGYLGHDPSGLGFDYIIVHESAHEWFGNSISARDLAEIWIHESFATYAEALYVEYFSDYEDAMEYMMNQRMNIMNRHPIVSDGGVASSGEFRSTDKYYKGSWMLQTMRYFLNDDPSWFRLLRSFNADFFHTITNSEEVIEYFEANTRKSVRPIMRQFLFHAKPPTLWIRNEDDSVMLRWEADEIAFVLPVEYEVKGQNNTYKKIEVGQEWIKLDNIKKLSVFDIRRNTGYFLVKEWKNK